MKRILMIGCGNMGSAIASQWVKMDKFSLTIAESDMSKVGIFNVPYVQLEQIENCFDIVVFSVKPHNIKDVLKQCSNAIHSSTILISLAAGIDLNTFDMQYDNPVFRAMPNVNAKIRESVTGIVGNKNTTQEHIEIVRTIIGKIGKVVILKSEADLDKLAAIAGSGPAFVMYIFEGYLKAAQELGVDYDLAYNLVYSTIKGTIANIDTTDTLEQIKILRDSVVSKGGMTQAGLDILTSKHQVHKIISDTLKAAYHKAIELNNV